MRTLPSTSRHHVPRAAALVTLGLIATTMSACAGGPGAPPAPVPATEAEWQALASPRPTSAPGAPRIALATVELTSALAWSTGSPVSASLGLTELVAAGLLRRADVRFVERRRFAAAADAERDGRARPRGAPAVGVSEGAEWVATVVLASLGAGQSALEIRLADAATGAVRTSRRELVPSDADPVGLARQAVAGILAALGSQGRLPEWTDPLPNAAPTTYRPSGASERAVEDFFAGLAAEEAWSWERARVAYQSAATSVGFVEAAAALARTARLRRGGTLGES
ncbi:MAG: hypothetical protein ABL963_11425 [Longimicrobiales bacterium]